MSSRDEDRMSLPVSTGGKPAPNAGKEIAFDRRPQVKLGMGICRLVSVGSSNKYVQTY